MILLTYTLAITMLISSPGPVVTQIIADAKHGWPVGTILGGALSALLLLAGALLLIYFAMSIDETILQWGQVIGGSYLIYLGISILRSSASPLQKETHHKDCFWRVMKIGLSNPKDILFFLAFLPSFISSEHRFMTQSISFLVIWLLVDLVVMIAYAGLAQKLLHYPLCQTALHYLPGIFMLLMGSSAIYLALY